jgi:hypothetical protein
MEIKHFKKENLSALVEFNKKMYPMRNKIEESIKYRFFDNPTVSQPWEYSIIAENGNGEIIGQYLLMPSLFYFQANKYKALWGMDYIVDETHRKSSIGAFLAKKATTESHFGFVNGKSLKILTGLHEQNIGSLVKFIRLNSLFLALKFIFKTEPKDLSKIKIPPSIKTKKGVFNRIYNPDEIISHEGFWNEDTLEFIRDEEFLRWRFFYYADKYFVYKYSQNNNNGSVKPTYFIVRPVVWKNVNCLLLVDYRYDMNSRNHFKEIIKATIKFMRKTNLAATITGSSLTRNNFLLKKKMFFPFGTKLSIVTNCLSNIKLEKHFKIMATFADADTELYYGNRKW